MENFPAYAGVAQLVEHNLAKVGVTSSNLATRSIFFQFRVLSSEFGVNHSHLVTHIFIFPLPTLNS